MEGTVETNNMKKTVKAFNFFVLLLVVAFLPTITSAATVKAPSILEVLEKYENGSRILEVKGLAPVDSEVLVYVNLQVAGIAKTNKENDSISSFFYSQKDRLPLGSYQVNVVARDNKSYTVSDFSGPMTVFEKKPVIEKKSAPQVIPPTLLRSVVDTDSAYNQPKIIGQAIAGSRIEIFIDGKKDGNLILDKINEGTIQFEYVVREKLSAGQHEVFLYAFDNDNNQSERSNLIYVNVVGDDSGRVVTEDKAELKVEETETKAESLPEEKTIDDLAAILNMATNTEDAATGITDENQKSKSSLTTNLFVFLLFLFAIIVWIFWVNRELIKEKDDSSDKDDKDDNDHTPLGDIDDANDEASKKDAEYGLDKKKRELDVLDF